MATDLRFGRGARYGAAIALELFATYLATVTDFSAILQAESYSGSIRNDVPIVDAVQFVVIVGVMSAAVLLLPTSGARRVGALTLVCVTFFLWATFGLLRGAGHLIEPAGLWSFVLNQGFIALLASVGGWLIARGRHPLTWLLAAVAVVPAIVGPRLVEANVTSGGYALVMQGIVIVGGLGAVWAGAAVDRMLVSRRDAATRRPGSPATR